MAEQHRRSTYPQVQHHPDYRKILVRGRQLWEQEKYDEAYDCARALLEDNPYDADALSLAGCIYERADNAPVAYHLFKVAVSICPTDGTHWSNLGRVAELMWRTKEAEDCYRKALKNVKRESTLQMLYANLSAMCVDNARYDEALKWCHEGLEKFPDLAIVRGNLGFAELALGKWDTGWKNYHYSLGTRLRTKFQYGNEPEWDGTPGKRVVLYGEQGIGDELSFASMVPDAIARCEKVIIDCDIRLAGLFARSFPKAAVYGTRKMPHDCALWSKEDQQFDASLAIGQCGEFLRQSPDDCPGTPYLIPDPNRTLMWKALWRTKNKPVIGIAWQGGTQRTGAKFRRWNLHQLLPVLQSVDAHWVCLEYRPAASAIEAFRKEHPEIDLCEYPHATLTKDYDDTAGLVASLDMVFCMQTSVAHLASAMGVPAWVCVPPTSQWRYGAKGSSVPWYKTMRVIRQSACKWDFAAIGRDLSDMLGVRHAA